MKKLALCLMTLIMCVCMLAPVSATNDDYVPSVTYTSTELVTIGLSEDGQEIVGYIVDKDGKVLSVAYRGCVRVDSLEEALDEESNIADSVRKLLIDLYNQFLNNEVKLSENSVGLNEWVAEKFGEENNADNLVIRDLFDIQVHHEECNNWLEQEGTTIDLTLDVDMEKDSVFQVIRFKDGKWELLEKVVNNNEDDDPENDGTITITSERYCPVAVVVPGEMNDGTTSGFNIWYAIIALIIAFIGWLMSKKAKKA